MADSHLQVNKSGHIVDAKTALLFDEPNLNSSDLQEEYIKTLFCNDCWEIVECENTKSHNFKITIKSELEELNVNVFFSTIRDESRKPDEFKMQLGKNSYPTVVELSQKNTMVLGFYLMNDETVENQSIDSFKANTIIVDFETARYKFEGNPSLRGARTRYLQHAQIYGYTKTELCTIFKPEFLFYHIYNKLNANQQTHFPIVLKEHKITSLQQIFYGAPGTGKSHATNEVAEMYDTIRTTFHPDCDYSTFVGAYKPTVVKDDRYELNGSHAVVLKYPDGENKDKAIQETRIEYKFVKQAFLKAYIKAWQLFEDSCKDGQELTPQFLVIEEINRGNCAQIFGDLFQLLDRKNGFSEYPIEADEDIVKALLDESPDDKLSFGKDGLQLSEEQKAYVDKFFNKPDKPKKNVAEKICKGEVLVLPPNLYIWATMNTSDQSLFPIDSAFKRRWDWKYMKIKDAKKKWKIGVEVKEGEKQDWWDFVQQINRVIANMTSSADKQLGYFFCKPTEYENSTESAKILSPNNVVKDISGSINANNAQAVLLLEDVNDTPTIISAETFVSKVVFYLWNDVFKDYGFEDDRLFKYKKKGEDGKEKEEDLTFPAFYKNDDDNSVDVDVVKQFIKNVMDWKAEETGKE